MPAGGSKPGERRGGRKKGTPNKANADLAARLKAMGCDPMEGMATLANDDKLDASVRGRMYAELAGYTMGKRRGRPVTFELPPIEDPDDALAAIAAITAAVAKGELTPDEGQSVASLLDSWRRTFELNDLAQRITALEATRDDAKP